MTYTFFAGFVLVQFAMLAIGLLGCRWFAQIARLSDAILIPSIVVLCVVGSYAIHNNIVEVGIMFLFGVIGYLMRKFDFNAAAMVLGLILGPIGENGLRRSLLLSDGDPSICFYAALLAADSFVCHWNFLTDFDESLGKESGRSLDKRIAKSFLYHQQALC